MIYAFPFAMRPLCLPHPHTVLHGHKRRPQALRLLRPLAVPSTLSFFKKTCKRVPWFVLQSPSLWAFAVLELCVCLCPRVSLRKAERGATPESAQNAV